MIWRKLLRLFGRGEKLYYDPWEVRERDAARVAHDLGLIVVEAWMNRRVWQQLRHRLPEINATRASFGLVPLFSERQILRFVTDPVELR
jgi:hypothetical protein